MLKRAPSAISGTGSTPIKPNVLRNVMIRVLHAVRQTPPNARVAILEVNWLAHSVWLICRVIRTNLVQAVDCDMFSRTKSVLSVRQQTLSVSAVPRPI